MLKMYRLMMAIETTPIAVDAPMRAATPRRNAPPAMIE
jgi:hypothetical protein